jgi:hypothetical protein
MADITQPQPVKLICGIIGGDEPLLARARDELQLRYGPADVISEIWPFDFTDYYGPQMGKGLLRQFLAFGRLIDPGRLADIKRDTNAIEAAFMNRDASLLPATHASQPARPINLDPGYLTPAKLVLASAKNFAHRVYLGGGIYAEVTLLYRGGWQKLDWTFPDYASGRYSAFMTDARNILMSQSREAGQ